ncbi:hypothetical protein NQ176_g6847 [Zarea fungicola]|uniref:Uncharacterized protein n=1 Tax=Zarea fungicola TaxID=93591 RepID=A0ACC1N2J2_9HYPO|nr:hypothetical protein NQ176_g6847 [Lecanicillium fungicola]
MASSKDDQATVACVNLMAEQDVEFYGFHLARTYYGDQDLWLAFKDKFDDQVEQGAAAVPAASARVMDRLRAKFLFRFADDKAYDGHTPQEVAAAFQIFEDEDDEGEDVTVEDMTLDDDNEESEDEDENEDAQSNPEDGGPGIVRSLCLMVNKESMRSQNEATPYVVAVDAMLHTGVDLGYPGYFKVAISALMPHLYAAVARHSLEDVAAAVDQDGIWRRMPSPDAQ